MSLLQHAQTLEAMALEDRETAEWAIESMHPQAYADFIAEAEALEAGAACLRREAAYHERLAVVIMAPKGA